MIATRVLVALLRLSTLWYVNLFTPFRFPISSHDFGFVLLRASESEPGRGSGADKRTTPTPRLPAAQHFDLDVSRERLALYRH